MERDETQLRYSTLEPLLVITVELRLNKWWTEQR